MKVPRPIPVSSRPGHRRRLAELIRLLPFFGVLLFFLPILWASGENAQKAATSSGWLYVFAAWFVLIGAAALLARAFDKTQRGADDSGDADP